jgi:hypothetical protein
VTPEGKLAWEFWNPDFKGSKRAAVYRMARMPLEVWDDLGTPSSEPRRATPTAPADAQLPAG